MGNNEELQKDVQDAIKWEPSLGTTEIGVIAKDGIITLTGTVDTYSKKTEAEFAAKNVKGVKAIVEKIEIKYDKSDKYDDTEIAKEILNAFKWNLQIPDDKLKVKVEKGWVSLDGDVNWNYQKEIAKVAVNKLIGVTGLTNNIVVKSLKKDTTEKSEIESALSRNWSINNQAVHVNVADSKVTLSGRVNSYYQKLEAERIAYSASGVSKVDNELVIDYQY